MQELTTGRAVLKAIGRRNFAGNESIDMATLAGNGYSCSERAYLDAVELFLTPRAKR